MPADQEIPAIEVKQSVFLQLTCWTYVQSQAVVNPIIENLYRESQTASTVRSVFKLPSRCLFSLYRTRMWHDL